MPSNVPDDPDTSGLRVVRPLVSSNLSNKVNSSGSNSRETNNTRVGIFQDVSTIIS